VFSLYGVPFTVRGSLVFARDFVIGEHCCVDACVIADCHLYGVIFFLQFSTKKCDVILH